MPAAAESGRARAHVREGNVRPLDEILPQIRTHHPGSFSDADGPFPDGDGGYHYRIKWITPEGRVIWFDTDARTGRVMGTDDRGRDRFVPRREEYQGWRDSAPDRDDDDDSDRRARDNLQDGGGRGFPAERGDDGRHFDNGGWPDARGNDRGDRGDRALPRMERGGRGGDWQGPRGGGNRDWGNRRGHGG